MTPGLRTWGQGAEPALLLHCSLAHSGAWDGVAKALSDILTMTAPDLVGHGRGPDWDRDQDFHDQNTDLAQSLLPDQPCHLIGHSFGATVALRLAERQPDRVKTLTLIEPVLFAAAPDAQRRSISPSANAERAALRQDGDLVEAARAFLGNWGNGTPYDALPPAQQRYMSERMPLIAASYPALHEDRAGLVPGLSRVTMPTLLMSGGASPPVVGAILDRLEDGIAQTHRADIAGAAHMLPITHPTEVAASIRAFIEAV